jgi:hypothetical protein
MFCGNRQCVLHTSAKVYSCGQIQILPEIIIHNGSLIVLCQGGKRNYKASKSAKCKKGSLLATEQHEIKAWDNRNTLQHNVKCTCL